MVTISSLQRHKVLILQTSAFPFSPPSYPVIPKEDSITMVDLGNLHGVAPPKLRLLIEEKEKKRMFGACSLY